MNITTHNLSNMSLDNSLKDLKHLGRINLSFNLNDPIPFASDFDNLFQPQIFLLALYVPIILVSSVTNMLLIVVALKCYTKNVTNIFLVNLSAAELLVTAICMPIQLSKAITLVWYYGETICKIVNYIQEVAVAVSVFSLTAMSVDRWLSVAPKPRLRHPGRRYAFLTIAILWITALLIFIPLLIVASVKKESVPVILKTDKNITMETKDVHFCTEEWPTPNTRKLFGSFRFTLVYAVPGSITILSYAFMGRTLCSVRPPFDIDEGIFSKQQALRLMKERKRVAWVLLLMAVLFALCWMPYNIMQLLLDVEAVDPKYLSMYLPYALFVGHANSAINPIVYCLMTKNFKRSLHKLLCGRPVCQQTKLKMNALRHDGNVQLGPVLRSGTQATTQLCHVTHSSRGTAPTHVLSADMLQRHGHIYINSDQETEISNYYMDESKRGPVQQRLDLQKLS